MTEERRIQLLTLAIEAAKADKNTHTSWASESTMYVHDALAKLFDEITAQEIVELLSSGVMRY